MAEREIADIYLKLRDQALSFGSVEIEAPPVVPGGDRPRRVEDGSRARPVPAACSAQRLL